MNDESRTKHEQGNENNRTRHLDCGIPSSLVIRHWSLVISHFPDGFVA
jgi:hypothetical protein